MLITLNNFAHITEPISELATGSLKMHTIKTARKWLSGIKPLLSGSSPSVQTTFA